MKESVSYQYMYNKAKIEGERHFLLSLITTRFDSIPKTISEKIKEIEDEQTLLELQKLIVTAENKQEFLKAFRILKI